LRGEVLYVDHFGNVITSIGRLLWEGEQLHLRPAFGSAPAVTLHAASCEVFAAGRALGAIRRTYGEVAPGEALALVGSEGLLELAVSHGHGGKALGLEVGAPVRVQMSKRVNR
nr:SAM-dependent chlorinase/fluorinase [Anaerolineae bacterium]